MSILKVDGGVVVKKDPPHRCTLPEPRRFDIGDIFVCDFCHSKHQLRDAQQYQGGPHWALLTGSQAEKP